MRAVFRFMSTLDRHQREFKDEYSLTLFIRKYQPDITNLLNDLLEYTDWYEY